MASRSPIVVEVKDVNGNVVTGATVTVRNRQTGLLPTIYLGETGSTTLSNPMTVDTAGRAVGWVDRGDYNATVAGTGIVSYTVPIDAAPAGDRDIDVLWGPTAWFPTVGTTLPTGPGDGDRFVYAPASSIYSPVELRYRTATLKWEFMGGGGHFDALTAGTRTLTGNVWTDTTSAWTTGTAATAYTVPFAGDYEITMMMCGMNSAGSVYLQLGIVVNGVTPPTEFVVVTTPAAAQQGTVMLTYRKTLAAGDIVKPYVLNNAGGTFTRNSQSTQIIPRAVA